jgi:hypothetical protein
MPIVAMEVVAMEVVAMEVAHPTGPSKVTATKPGAAPTEARVAATATAWSGSENWSSQHRRKKATQEE